LGKWPGTRKVPNDPGKGALRHRGKKKGEGFARRKGTESRSTKDEKGNLMWRDRMGQRESQQRQKQKKQPRRPWTRKLLSSLYRRKKRNLIATRVALFRQIDYRFFREHGKEPRINPDFGEKTAQPTKVNNRQLLTACKRGHSREQKKHNGLGSSCNFPVRTDCKPSNTATGSKNRIKPDPW